MLNVTNKIFDWNRIWIKRGDTIHYDNHGFLRVLSEKDTWRPSTGCLYTNELAIKLKGTQILVLLGEPGIGKTVEFKRLYQNEEEEFKLSGDIFLKFELIDFASDSSLKEEIFANKNIENWKKTDKKLFLYLDGLDEGMLSISVLTKVLARELRKLPLERVFLCITCRSAVWPKPFEESLLKE